MPTLEAMVRFSGARQRILAHNIANLDTPNFQPVDVSIGSFQAQLRRAVDARRDATGGDFGELAIGSTREVEMGPGGSMRLTPRTHGQGILFHDRNNRDLERTVQDMVENVGVFRMSADLLRSRHEILKLAMGER